MYENMQSGHLTADLGGEGNIFGALKAPFDFKTRHTGSDEIGNQFHCHQILVT